MIGLTCLVVPSIVVGFDFRPQIKSAVKVFPNDAVNRPGVQNTHWTVEVALPISKLMERNSLASRPADGVFWRMNFSRVQWGVATTADGYEKRPCCQSCATPGSVAEDNWVWSKQGAVAMHLPEVSIVQITRNDSHVC